MRGQMKNLIESRDDVRLLIGHSWKMFITIFNTDRGIPHALKTHVQYRGR